MIKTLLTLIGALTTFQAYADLTITDFENKSKTRSTNTYLLGLSAGLNAANNKLTSINQVPLYCFPPYLKLTTNNYREIISLGIQDLTPSNPVKPSVDEVLLQQLIKIYPCGYN
ncbi:hypothetical protein [Polynucleobacter sp. MWH-HuK1]|uniref:hypothetical protein n=1 Tax=Polynucleobacter sp. MWH-HuK1 TaxID=1743158 RepID=UPI001C0BAEEF|nr:hypothetical protein [Polynucleobacter sp. MWH-HuK1]MBU3565340.1 hypothetical protein [Polynucleobacter sp. MWH-HuK1]